VYFDILNRVGVTDECDRQIDRQTDGWRLYDIKCRTSLGCVAHKSWQGLLMKNAVIDSLTYCISHDSKDHITATDFALIYKFPFAVALCFCESKPFTVKAQTTLGDGLVIQAEISPCRLD